MKISLNETLPAEAVDPVELISLHDALTALRALNARQARVVELRYFGGLSFEEVAEVLGLAIPTVKLDWSLAKAWLFKELTKVPTSRESL